MEKQIATNPEIFKYVSKQDVMAIIKEVALKCSTKPHSIYGIDDLKQHVTILCWQKLDEFDFAKIKTKNIKKALENFLSNMARKRLINLHRDMVGAAKKSFKKDTEFTKQYRKSLLEPSSTEMCDEIDNMVENIFSEDTDYLVYISSQLDDENIEILDGILSGDKIPSNYKNQLFETIKLIMKNA